MCGDDYFRGESVNLCTRAQVERLRVTTITPPTMVIHPEAMPWQTCHRPVPDVPIPAHTTGQRVQRRQGSDHTEIPLPRPLSRASNRLVWFSVGTVPH